MSKTRAAITAGGKHFLALVAVMSLVSCLTPAASRAANGGADPVAAALEIARERVGPTATGGTTTADDVATLIGDARSSPATGVKVATETSEAASSPGGREAPADAAPAVGGTGGEEAAPAPGASAQPPIEHPQAPDQAPASQNLSVDIRVLSPGDNGAVTQVNVAGSGATPGAGEAQNVSVAIRVLSPGDNGAVTQVNLEPGAGANGTTSPAPGSGTPSGGVPAGTTPAPGSVWEWTWDCAGLPVIPALTSPLAGWTWIWSWTCADDPRSGLPSAGPPPASAEPTAGRKQDQAAATLAPSLSISGAQNLAPGGDNTAPPPHAPPRGGGAPVGIGGAVLRDGPAAPAATLITGLGRAAAPARSADHTGSRRGDAPAPQRPKDPAPEPGLPSPLAPAALTAASAATSSSPAAAIAILATLTLLGLAALTVVLEESRARGARHLGHRLERPG